MQNRIEVACVVCNGKIMGQHIGKRFVGVRNTTTHKARWVRNDKGEQGWAHIVCSAHREKLDDQAPDAAVEVSNAI
jgi:hypothetical protein